MAAHNLPFEALRKTLYTPEELLAGLDESDPASLARTTDFAIYRYWVTEGRNKPRDYFGGMMQVVHDHAITQALAGLVAGRRVAAIMGGHEMERGTPIYRAATLLARELTRAGLLVASGGGPGAMEATHLGALFASEPPDRLDTAHRVLAAEPVFPEHAGKVVAEDGTVDAALLERLFRWYLPVLEVRREIARPAESLGIPTWQYGHEPCTPLATHLAKYFENSVREDGLLAIAGAGIVYAPGRAGTLQEIFQDAAINLYATARPFSPMVFLGRSYWTEAMPVGPLLCRLFGEENYSRFVRITDSVEDTCRFLLDSAPERPSLREAPPVRRRVDIWRDLPKSGRAPRLRRGKKA